MAAATTTVETSHADMIHDAAFDYYSKRLATCSSDRLVKVYDISPDQQYQHVADLGGHDGPVWQVQWAHPKFGVLLASCSYDQRVIVHREAAPGQWQQIYVHDLQSSVNSLAWAPHEFDLCLACACSDGKVAILSHNQDDTWSSTLVQDSQLGVNAVTWAPFGALGEQTADGKTVKRIATGSCDNCVRIWALREGETEWSQEHVLQGHTDWVRDAAWAPSTGLPCNTLASCSEDGSVFIWSQDTAGGPWRYVALPQKYDSPVYRVSWSLTGNVLAVSTGDSTVTLWKESLDRSWVQIADMDSQSQQQQQAQARPPM